MERKIYQDLKKWKEDKDRKPLIIDGARQIGKTWIIQEFGRREYENLVYINCDKIIEMQTVFYDYNTERLLRAFSAITGETIEKEKTLIFLDEIQEAPKGITALKYFCEDAREYHIVAAGSLLGVSLHDGTGFPVGKVDELKMYPMTFEEFLLASGNTQIVNLLKSHKWDEISSLSSIFIDLLRQYYYVGGMPEVVNNYFEFKNLKKVRDIQKTIISDYEQDFAKHIPANLLAKVKTVWNSIPSQLAKENKKYIYNILRKGARAKDYEDAIEWLIKAGLIYKVVRVNKIEKPLKFYEDIDNFKLFISDLGLLGAMSEVSASEILVKENYFSEYKGAFTEQYVAQELISNGEKAYYYSKENSTLEIDFIIQKENIIPIEVKAEENAKSKSLRTVYNDDNNLKPCRFSMLNYKQQDWITNIPLYLVSEWIKTI